MVNIDKPLSGTRRNVWKAKKGCYAHMLTCCSLVVTCWEKVDLLALLYVMLPCDFFTFPYGILGQVWYLIVWIPDFCRLSYFYLMHTYAKFYQNISCGSKVLSMFTKWGWTDSHSAYSADSRVVQLVSIVKQVCVCFLHFWKCTPVVGAIFPDHKWVTQILGMGPNKTEIYYGPKPAR